MKQGATERARQGATAQTTQTPSNETVFVGEDETFHRIADHRKRSSDAAVVACDRSSIERRLEN
jgi:hypothetical protein